MLEKPDREGHRLKNDRLRPRTIDELRAGRVITPPESMTESRSYPQPRHASDELNDPFSAHHVYG